MTQPFETDLHSDYLRADLFFSVGQPVEAARILEPLVAAEPGNEAALELLARSYFGSAQLQRSEDALRRLVAQKNADELLQNFVWHTRDASLDRARVRTGTGTGAGKVEVAPASERTDGDEARRHLRTLLSLVFTNAEVRKLASDMGVVGRDLLARGAEKIAAAARPTEEQLSTVDQPGPEHRFVTEEGREVGSGETAVRLVLCVFSVEVVP